MLCHLVLICEKASNISNIKVTFLKIHEKLTQLISFICVNDIQGNFSKNAAYVIIFLHAQTNASKPSLLLIMHNATTCTISRMHFIKFNFFKPKHQNARPYF